MRSVKRSVVLSWSVLIALVVVLALGLAACGGGSSGSETSSTVVAADVSTTIAADATTQAPQTTAAASSVSTEGSPSTEAVSTTTSVSVTTTTMPSTTTTAKATTTTAKVTVTTAKPTTTTIAATTTTGDAGPVVLTLKGPSGTKTFTMAELRALPAVSGYGGWKNQMGNITAPAAWKGPSISSLVKLVGGGSSVTVIASDGYSSNVIPGAKKATYDPATGESIEGITVTVILAYSKNGGSIGGEEGPLRIAFVSPEQNQVTDGSEWARMVVELRVK